MKLSRKRRQIWIAMGICGILAAVIFLTMRLILRRTAWITLPDAVGTTGISVNDPVGTGYSVTPLEITPRTVQAAVATMKRVSDYARVVKITRFWNGGSGEDIFYIYASSGWTRVDRAYGGRVRHVLTDGSICHIWYDDESESVTIPAGCVNADDEQNIPVYEEVLSLSADEIITANYQRHENRNCIYLETSENNLIYRYWIDTATGLLESAEILSEGDLIFQMESSDPEEPPENAWIFGDFGEWADAPEN